MYSGIRCGKVECGLFIGGSHAKKLSSAASLLGLDAYKLASGGWKPTEGNVNILLPEIEETLDSLPKDCPVILFCLDNAAYMGLRNDGSMQPFSKCVQGDSGYHGVGNMIVTPEISMSSAMTQLGRIVEMCSGHPTFVISPLPRYIAMPCCDDNTHITNFTDPNFFTSIMGDLLRMRHALKRQLPTVTILDSMDLLCGPGYSLAKAEETARAGWVSDPVHPNGHSYAKIALNLLNRISMVEPAQQEENRKRKRQDSGRDSGSSQNYQQHWQQTERSQQWKQGPQSGYGTGRGSYQDGPRGQHNMGRSGHRWNRGGRRGRN